MTVVDLHLRDWNIKRLFMAFALLAVVMYQPCCLGLALWYSASSVLSFFVSSHLALFFGIFIFNFYSSNVFNSYVFLFSSHLKINDFELFAPNKRRVRTSH